MRLISGYLPVGVGNWDLFHFNIFFTLDNDKISEQLAAVLEYGKNSVD
ncbi:MAG: hypothetical protein ACTSRK_10615 [Promethearchaeota archaeon]